VTVLDWGEMATGTFEGAHLCLLDARNLFIERDEIPSQFVDALQQVYIAWEELSDPLAALRQASNWIQEVLTQDPSEKPQGVDQYLASSLAALRSLEATAASRPAMRTHQKIPLVASRGVPTVRMIERPVISPLQSTAPTIFMAPPDMESQEGWLKDPLPALTLEGWRFLRFEELIRDIAICGMNRIPQLGDPWRSALFGEDRMLRDLDAVLAIEGADLGAVEQLFSNSPSPDPTLLFAVALLGGSLFGRDGLAMAERCLMSLEEDREFEDALVSAWTMTPHPAIEGLARWYLREHQPARRRLGLRLLIGRRTVTLEELEKAAFDVPEVAASALVPLVLKSPPHLRQRLDELWARFQTEESRELSDQWLIARVLAAYPHATVDASKRLLEGDVLGARLLGIASSSTDAERLLEWVAAEPSPALVEALGWAGDPKCLPFLVGLLALEDEGLTLTAAMSLERITGAGLVEEVDLPPEAVMEADPLAKPLPNSLVLENKSRDPAEEGSPDTIELPSRDQERWRAYVQEHRETLVPGVRTRRGVLYSPLVSLNELDRGPLTPAERTTLHWEIIVRAGLNASFDGLDLVVRQEADIAHIKARLEQSPVEPGAWHLPLHRK